MTWAVGRTMLLTLDRASIRSLQACLGRYDACWVTEKERLERYEPFLAAEPSNDRERS